MVKQIFASIVIVMLFITSLQAQDSRFKFGFQLSPSISWMNTDDPLIDGDGTALGLKLGTQAEYFFAQYYSISSGIGFHFNTGGTLLSQYQGEYFTSSVPSTSAYSNVTPSGNVNLKYAIQYVEIPLALKLRTREFGYWSYNMEAPIFTIGIRSNGKGTLTGGGISEVLDDISIKKEINPLVLSWGFGGGAEYSVSESTRLAFSIIYQRVFTDATRDKDYTYINRDFPDDPKAGINSITFRFGILF